MLRLAVRRMPACTAAFPRSALALTIPAVNTQVRSFSDTPKDVHPGQIWTPPTLGSTKISKKFLFTQFSGDRSVHSIGNRVVSLIATAGLVGMAFLYWNSGLWAHSFVTPTLLIATILWLQLHIGSWAILTGGILAGGYVIYLFIE